MKFKKFKSLHQVNENVIVPAFLRARLIDEAYKIEECGNYIRTLKCTNCGTHHFKGFSRCRSRYCAICNKAKSMLWLAKLYPYLKVWLESGNYIVFVNYTIRDRENLKAGLTVLQEAWRYMTHECRESRRWFKNRYVGGMKSLEVKIGENSGKWHPHLHTMVLKRKYSKDDYDFLAPAWSKAIEAVGGGKYGTPTQEGIVYLESFSAYSKRGGKKLTYEERLLKSIMEVAKYMTKFDYVNDTPEHLQELLYSCKGVRQMSTWGVLYKIPKEVDKALETMNNDEIMEFTCQVCGCDKCTVERLYKRVWQDEYIADYSTKPPEDVDERHVQYVKELNEMIDKVATEYIQEEFEIYRKAWE